MVISKKVRSMLKGLDENTFLWLEDIPRTLSKRQRLKSNRKHYAGFKLNSLTVFVGDCVHINIGMCFQYDISEKFAIARILDCYDEGIKNVKGFVKVQWYSQITNLLKSHRNKIPEGIPPLDDDLDIVKDMWAYETNVDLETIIGHCHIAEVNSSVSPHSVQKPTYVKGPLYTCRFMYVKNSPWLIPYTNLDVENKMDRSPSKRVSLSPKQCFVPIVNICISPKLDLNPSKLYSQILNSGFEMSGDEKYGSTPKRSGVKRKLLHDDEDQENCLKKSKHPTCLPVIKKKDKSLLSSPSIKGGILEELKISSPKVNVNQKLKNDIKPAAICRGLPASDIVDLLRDEDTRDEDTRDESHLKNSKGKLSEQRLAHCNRVISDNTNGEKQLTGITESPNNKNEKSYKTLRNVSMPPKKFGQYTFERPRRSQGFLRSKYVENSDSDEPSRTQTSRQLKQKRKTIDGLLSRSQTAEEYSIDKPHSIQQVRKKILKDSDDEYSPTIKKEKSKMRILKDSDDEYSPTIKKEKSKMRILKDSDDEYSPTIKKEKSKMRILKDSDDEYSPTIKKEKSKKRILKDSDDEYSPTIKKEKSKKRILKDSDDEYSPTIKKKKSKKRQDATPLKSGKMCQKNGETIKVTPSKATTVKLAPVKKGDTPNLTPQKNKAVQQLPLKGETLKVTPLKGKGAKSTPSKRLDLSMKLPQRLTPLAKRITEFEQARAQLHVSAIPPFLPCREEEFQQIYSFVEGKLLDSTGGCMYISGVPGTGKTATVREVVRLLQECEEEGTLPSFHFLEVNAMKLTKPHQLWVQIWEGLSGLRVTADHAYSLLQKSLRIPSGPQRKSIFLLLDELDLLWTRKQDVMYNLFDLSSCVGSRLIVVTIANTMDLPERMMISRVSSRLGLTRMTFQPYTFRQLEEIITTRLSGIKAFDPDAIQLVSRKVAAVSGDARRALDVCRRATELAEQRKMELLSSPQKSLQKMNVLVGMTHVSTAIEEMFSSPKIKAIRCSSQMEKYILQAILMEFTRTGLEEAVSSRIFEHLNGICRFEGFCPPSSSETFKLINNLSSQKILLTEHSRLDLLLRIRFNLSCEDVSYALKA